MVSKYSIEYTATVLKSIKSSLSYISIKLFNPVAAKKLLNLINEAINKISNFPFAFPDCSIFYINDTFTRHIIIKNYILIYRINEKKNVIYILDFFYSKVKINNIYSPITN